MNPPVQLYQGDCLDVLASLELRDVRLAYLDPPFNTRRTRRAENGRFADSWLSITDYLTFIQPRIERCIASLHEDGVLLVHCDWRTSHHLRLVLEEMLGADAFVNHLIWAYGLGGSSPRRFARKHDDILFFARSNDYFFAPPTVPASSRRMQGSQKKATDVLNIPAINNMARERVGYPTQKPLALMRLLVGACCPPGGLVLDPFCGSGSTLVAAHALGHSAIGIDTNPDAVAIASHRLEEGSSSAIEAHASK